MRHSLTNIDLTLVIKDMTETVVQTFFDVGLDCLCLFTATVGLIETTRVNLAV